MYAQRRCRSRGKRPTFIFRKVIRFWLLYLANSNFDLFRKRQRTLYEIPFGNVAKPKMALKPTRDGFGPNFYGPRPI